MAPIMKEVILAAPIDQVWAALTEAEAMEGWMGEGSVELEPMQAWLEAEA